MYGEVRPEMCAYVICGSLDRVHLWHHAAVPTGDDTTDGLKSIFEGGATASPRWRQPLTSRAAGGCGLPWQQRARAQITHRRLSPH